MQKARLLVRAPRPKCISERKTETIRQLADPLLRKTKMAVIELSRSANVSNGGFSVFNSLITALVSRNDARKTRNALRKLTARELEDIGLTRGDIENIARNTSQV